MSPLEHAWREHRKVWGGDLDPRIRFTAGFRMGLEYALQTQPARILISIEDAERLGIVYLTADELDVVAPVLLEAGTRHLEQRGTAWHDLGRRLHAIAERLYSVTNRTTKETTDARPAL